jgi:hypothetical protein
MNGKLIKILNVVAVVATLGGSLLSSYVSEQKNKDLIAKLVDDRLKQK